MGASVFKLFSLILQWFRDILSKIKVYTLKKKEEHCWVLNALKHSWH